MENMVEEITEWVREEGAIINIVYKRMAEQRRSSNIAGRSHRNTMTGGSSWRTVVPAGSPVASAIRFTLPVIVPRISTGTPVSMLSVTTAARKLRDSRAKSGRIAQTFITPIHSLGVHPNEKIDDRCENPSE